jgi:hypothetical protein
VPKRAKRATVEAFTLEAFLETPDAYWERKRQQWATPSGATLENGEEVFPARELGPLTPENRDALLQWRAAAFAHAEGKPGTAASKLEHTSTLPRVEGGLGYYLQCYCAAFAWRFIQESGATLESVSSWEWGSWTMDGTLLVAPRGARPLARADGSAAIRWEEWLAERNAAGEDDNFTTLLTGLRLIAFRVAREEKATLEAALADAAARRDSPPLRLPTRAYKTHVPSRRRWIETLATLRQQGRLTPKELELWKARQPVRLTAEELVVVAGLLDIARRHGPFRQYEAARVRAGSYSLDIRFAIDMPNLAEFARLLGYAPNDDGRITSDARRHIAQALHSLAHVVRPIVVETWTREGSGRAAKPVRSFEIMNDVPVREVKAPDGKTRLELHPTLAAGYWWGHIILDRIPQQWARAREALGMSKLSAHHKAADFYFRSLAVARTADAARKHRKGGEPVPATLERKLKVEPLLELLDLEDTRRQKGAPETARILGQTIEFAKACGSVLAWRWEGAGKLPTHVVVTMPAAVPEVDPERVAVQEELFPELAEDPEEEPLGLAEAGALGDADWELEA